MKKITLLFLFIAIICFANNTIAQKKVKAYGFQLYALSDWDIDKDKTFVMISSPDSRADVTIEEHAVTNEEGMKKTILRFFSTNGIIKADQIKKYGKSREFVKNGSKVIEIFVKTPPDEDGDIIWFKVWMTTNKKKTKMVLFGAYNLIEKGKSSTEHTIELDGLLDSITPL